VIIIVYTTVLIAVFNQIVFALIHNDTLGNILFHFLD